MADRKKLLVIVLGCLLLLAVFAALLWFRAYRSPTFAAWLEHSGEANRVELYRRMLARHGVADVVAMDSVLSAKRDAVRCGVEPWIVPPEDLWPNLVPALIVVRELRTAGLLQIDEVTSVYRSESLNNCAGGAARSKHLGNRAIDLRLLAGYSEQRYLRICQFWHANGRRLGFGLGFYDNNQIHIDGDGFRTWGVNYSANSSPCAKQAAR